MAPWLFWVLVLLMALIALGSVGGSAERERRVTEKMRRG